jgi:alkaline phosphatase
MVEAGDIDWAAHDNNLDNLIGTVLDFDKAIGSTIEWINQNGGWADNQLIITADHDHYLTLNGDYPTLVRNLGAEQLTTIDTIAESGHFWGTSATDKYEWGTHTNRPVPVYYQGVDSETLTNSIGTGFESYGFQIPGLANTVDQVHIAKTLFASVTEVNQEDLVSGTTGADTLTALQNIDGVQDTVFTGAGNDEVDLAFNTNARNNIIDTGSDNDEIYVSRNDRVFGSDGDDTFFAQDGKGGNRMSGGAGDDTFFLGNNDRALGGDGNDIFRIGLGGGNLISGGAGADQFWIVNAELPKAINTVLDFQIGTDVIGISGAVSLGITTANLTLTQVGADTAVIFGGQTLATLTGIQASALSVANPNQFVLV